MDHCISALFITLTYDNNNVPYYKLDNYDAISQSPNRLVDFNFYDPLATRSNPNRLMSRFRLLGLDGSSSYSVFIPKIFLKSSRKQRLQLLAGLIDADGYYDVKGKGYQYTSISEQLALDVVELSRSLGFAAYVKKHCATLKGKFISDKYVVSISGDLSCIPVLIGYKKNHLKY